MFPWGLCDVFMSSIAGISIAGVFLLLCESGSLGCWVSVMSEWFVLVQTVACTVEGGRAACLVSTDAVVVQLLFELVKLGFVAVGDEQCCFPHFCGSLLGFCLVFVASYIKEVCAEDFVGGNIKR